MYGSVIPIYIFLRINIIITYIRIYNIFVIRFERLRRNVYNSKNNREKFDKKSYMKNDSHFCVTEIMLEMMFRDYYIIYV